MFKKSSLLQTQDIEVLRDGLINCHHKNKNDSIQQVDMYIYDLTIGADIYVVEYNDETKLLIGIINPLRTRNSIKINTYSLNDFENHELYYQYYEDLSLLEGLSNLESNEYYLLQKKLI